MEIAQVKLGINNVEMGVQGFFFLLKLDEGKKIRGSFRGCERHFFFLLKMHAEGCSISGSSQIDSIFQITVYYACFCFSVDAYLQFGSGFFVS